MIPVTIVLMDFSGGKYNCGDLSEIAGVLNMQVQSDFYPAWGGHPATVLPGAVDSTAWRVELHDGIDSPGALGYHTDEHHQPYAVIDVAQGDPVVTMSHEICEMLADPWGSRLHTVRSWAEWRQYARVGDDHATVRPLIEVCDPCEAITYQVGGVDVSDFTLKPYWRSEGRQGEIYTHAGSIRRPMRVLPSGYISFMDPLTGIWYQLFEEVNGQAYQTLGRFESQSMHSASQFTTLREWTDHMARQHRSSR